MTNRNDNRNQPHTGKNNRQHDAELANEFDIGNSNKGNKRAAKYQRNKKIREPNVPK
jgi:hypothetical protein